MGSSSTPSRRSPASSRTLRSSASSSIGRPGEPSGDSTCALGAALDLEARRHLGQRRVRADGRRAGPGRGPPRRRCRSPRRSARRAAAQRRRGRGSRTSPAGRPTGHRGRPPPARGDARGRSRPRAPARCRAARAPASIVLCVARQHGYALIQFSATAALRPRARPTGRRRPARSRPGRSTPSASGTRAPPCASRTACSPAAAASPTCSALPSEPKAERRPPARSSASATAWSALFLREAVQTGRGDGGADAAADRRRVPAALVERRVARPRKRRGRLEAGRVGVEHRRRCRDRARRPASSATGATGALACTSPGSRCRRSRARGRRSRPTSRARAGRRPRPARPAPPARAIRPTAQASQSSSATR